MPDPRARAAAGVLAIVGALVSNDPIILLCGWLAVFLLTWRTKILPQHLKFLIGALVPIGILLVLIWGVVVGAPPGAELGSDRAGGLLFAATILLRLAILGGVTQLLFLTVSPEDLPGVLSRCGIRGEALIVALGTVALLPELKHRADQVLTARFALGAMPDRKFLTRAKEFPHMLRPLLAWALRSAVQRSESWHQRHVFSRVEEFSAGKGSTSTAAGVLVVALSALWLGLNIAAHVWKR